MENYKGDTFVTTLALAPQLVTDRGPDQPMIINSRLFYELFGEETEEGEPGLDRDFQMREGDHGHLSFTELGGELYMEAVI